jgi:hypothetical protein
MPTLRLRQILSSAIARWLYFDAKSRVAATLVAESALADIQQRAKVKLTHNAYFAPTANIVQRYSSVAVL